MAGLSELPALVAADAPRHKRGQKTTRGSYTIYNKLGLRFLPPPPLLWVLLGCLWVSAWARGEKLYLLKLPITLSKKVPKTFPKWL